MALPLGILHTWLINWRKPEGAEDDKRRIELWVLFWTFLDFYLVFAFVAKHPWVAVFPILRLSDLLYILVKAFLVGKPPKPPERALILLFVHYFEVIQAFAAIYLVLQWFTTDGLFKVDSVMRKLTGPEALYFSFITGSTIGFGDIYLKVSLFSAASSDWAKCAAVAIVVEVFCLFAITLLEIPRVLAVKPELAPHDKK